MGKVTAVFVEFTQYIGDGTAIVPLNLGPYLSKMHIAEPKILISHTVWEDVIVNERCLPGDSMLQWARILISRMLIQ